MPNASQSNSLNVAPHALNSTIGATFSSTVTWASAAFLDIFTVDVFHVFPSVLAYHVNDCAKLPADQAATQLHAKSNLILCFIILQKLVNEYQVQI